MASSFVRKGKTVGGSSSSPSPSPSPSSPSASPSPSSVPQQDSSLPAGTRPSLHNGQLLVSTGLDDLDRILGGGIAIGTIVLVEEDVHSAYAETIVRYFVSESLICDHSLFLATNSIGDYLNLLPSLATSEEEEAEKEAPKDASNELKIAWRYQQELAKSTKKNQNFSHSFDLSR
eukprot:TRINITY_DN5190_c0_g2_i2.p2 TRINITY_DN5190_c0_g2~~TRINITY_DN5190_c0_g2_i2.p2  ORF type:complete len:175 (+),score=62.89 TRINITY_DN5190_c0_g2_i2:125-649(+)